MPFSKFDALSVRPPTPPKDQEDAKVQVEADVTLQFLDDPFSEKPVPARVKAAKAVLNTPEQSPSSDISIPSSSASRRKRVNFQLQTCAVPSKKAIAQSWTPTRSSPLRPLPQTRVSKPLKSILKPSDGTPTPPPADQGAAAHKFKTFGEMLESIVKLLASAERPSRLDAYHSLQRTMQAYDKIPDDQALRRKMSLLTQFIRRDMQAPSPTGTGLDSQLVAQALKLLMALFRITDLTTAMDDDFCSYVVDRIIHVAGDTSMPKAVVNSHLAVLMQQSFRPKTMTLSRTEKILDALDTIHERISGFSVQAYRVRIYRKIIQQRPDAMIKHTERWCKLTMKALVSVQKDIHQAALDTVISAAKTIGHDRHVGKSVLAILNRPRNDGGTFGTVLTQELERMLGGDNAAMVPQIWGAVTALLRESLVGYMFSAMKDWLGIFEKFLSPKKDLVKVHANVAFCFLLYAVNLSPDTPESWTKMFLNIPLHQLQQRLPAKKSERDAVTAGYITLLYYALRPTASFEQLDRYWTEFVAGFWKPLIHSSSHHQAFAACQVVSALLDGSRKPWNEHRALELRPQYMIQRGELPLVDPKWVRKSLSLVLELVETILDATLWTESKQLEDDPIQAMWLAVMDSLVEASSKEVMASSETKDAMAHLVNLLRRIWDRHTAKLALPQQKEDLWADKFCFLIDTVIQKLGAFQFADKSLTRNDKNEFEVASTPSHRSRQQYSRISPLLYLLDLLVNQSEGKLPDSVRLRAMELIVEPCFNAQNTRLSKLELLRDCASTVDRSLSTTVASSFWMQIAILLDSTIQQSTAGSDARASRSLGKEYEIVVDILGLGSTVLTGDVLGHKVLSSFTTLVRQEAGEGALILAVIERVSECVLKRTLEEENPTCLAFSSILLRSLPKQMSRRVLEQGRQNLWPSSPANGRSLDFDPYNHLYGAIVTVGSVAYRDLDIGDVEPTKDFLNALSSSIRGCSTSHLAVYLRKMQDMLRLWVEDPDEKMQSKAQPLKSLHLEVVSMWREVNTAIQRLPRKDSQILLHLESLITAGFSSRRRSIVNISISTWNTTFGKEESLRYPSRLEQALRRLRYTVELTLPSLAFREDGLDTELAFYDSDSAAEEAKLFLKSPHIKASPFRISKAKRRSTSRSPAVPTSATRRASSRHTPKVRLRHDNSQIKFEPIVSSPSNPFNQESQVLTERQQEMVDRQRLTTGLFANMGANSPQPDEARSPMEIHSDALTADDLPDRASRTTPLKALAAMGPMDAFLGSSPTPHARKSTQHITSDETNVATPTAVRSARYVQDHDLGSSPPRFEQQSGAMDRPTDSEVQVGSSFEYRQTENAQSMSFDDGTTIDEDALLAAVAKSDKQQAALDLPEDTIMSELPSSNIDLQLTAQIDADMQTAPNTGLVGEEAPESNAEFVDAASHPQSSSTEENHAGSDTEVDESQPSSHAVPVNTSQIGSQADTSSTSRVGDSFKTSSEKGTPKAQKLRRSSRNSMGSPAEPSSAKKRKQTPNKKKNNGKKTKAIEEEAPSQSSQQHEEPDEDGMLDNIIVASPKKQNKSKKRKSMSNDDSAAKSHIMVPETSRKLGTRRSQSLLSQVENSQDILVEGTPAPKRARQSLNRDVSEAKKKEDDKDASGSQKTKRLSHVQITPRRSSEKSSSVHGDSPAIIPDKPTITGPAEDEDAPAEPSESQSQSQVSQPPTGINTPSRSFTERVILTPRSIINQLKNLKDYLFSAPQLVMERDEEREMDDVLFDIRRQVHAAGMRGEDGKKGE